MARPSVARARFSRRAPALLLDEARVGPEALLIAVLGAHELHVALVDADDPEALPFGHRQAPIVVEVLLLRLCLAVALVVQYGIQIVFRQTSPRILRQLNLLLRLERYIAVRLRHRKCNDAARQCQKKTGTLQHVVSPIRSGHELGLAMYLKACVDPRLLMLGEAKASASTIVVRPQ
ncbi:hypothetical protein Y023_5113 [Burkholderia pseudomallei A79D]|nr:hypothetical protein Y023_5113 [Burkholderia pseudomallei A79D]KGX97308.1 hypothetical protein X997_4796 [Burkholderia pseudomallei A79C]